MDYYTKNKYKTEVKKMNKQEFEERAKTKVTVNEYQSIEEVYCNHPAIHNVKGKDQIVKIYNEFGFGAIESMYQKAMEWKEKEEREFILRQKLAEISNNLQKIAELRKEERKKWRI
jgi:hypothetical protein